MSYQSKKKVIPFNLKQQCTEEELTYLNFLYEYAPISDFGICDDSFFLDVVRHCLEVRKNTPWCQELTEEMFCNFVLMYRVNNENPVFYHKIIAEQLQERIKGKSLKEAILEINYWCLEKATYQTTNSRTASPLTVMNNAYGRCGEESTFTVSALRSVGIAARQCYAPRWSHCDDNHAWVEVWTGQKWEYLGACEPEMELNTGWFQIPASKAMLIHTNTYQNEQAKETEVGRKNGKIELNVLEHYAQTKELVVSVIDACGAPLENAHVSFEVVNYSELFSLATLNTDEQGKVTFKTGLGDLWVHVYKDNLSVSQKVNVEESPEITICFTEKDETNTSIEFRPATGMTQSDGAKSAELEQLEKEKTEQAVAIRLQTVSGFETEETALAYETSHGLIGATSALVGARGNVQEIKNFLEHTENKKLAIQLLNTLTQKDLSDITEEILNDHLLGSLKFSEKQIHEYANELISPRILDEMIYSFRKEIEETLSSSVKVQILENPEYAIFWVRDNIMIGNDHLHISPKAVLKTGIGNALSNKILAVAIMRTLGIPAKLTTEENNIAYYHNQNWMLHDGNKQQHKDCELCVVREKDSMLEYFQNFTIAKKEGKLYHTLDLSAHVWKDDRIICAVESGHYRFIRTNRQPDETNLVDIEFYVLDKAEKLTIHLEALHNKEAETVIEIKEVSLRNQKQENISLLSQLPNDKKHLCCWLQLKAEPTEHLLNEIIELKDYFKKADGSLLLMVKSLNQVDDTTLQKALDAVPNLQLLEDKNFDIDYLMNAFCLADTNLPLAIVSSGSQGKFAFSGYQVGIGEMILKCLK